MIAGSIIPESGAIGIALIGIGNTASLASNFSIKMDTQHSTVKLVKKGFGALYISDYSTFIFIVQGITFFPTRNVVFCTVLLNQVMGLRGAAGT